MNLPGELVERLVTEMHLRVPERAEFFPESVRYSEVAAVITRVLNQTGPVYQEPRLNATHGRDMTSSRSLGLIARSVGLSPLFNLISSTIISATRTPF